jgi:hypothetical protein
MVSPTIVATPTTPLGQGVLVGEDGRRLVARAREMQYNAGVLKTFDEVREIRGGGGGWRGRDAVQCKRSKDI